MEFVVNVGMVVWNGFMGVFEMFFFDEGMKVVVEVIVGSNVISIIGGGDSVVVV